MALKPGTVAPAFSASASEDGVTRTIALADYRGRKLVLYFYPMDSTPGCTAQACSLRDYNGEIAKRGAAILGVSAQDEASHLKFAQKYHLNFPLLCDTDLSIATAYDATGSGVGKWIRGKLGITDRVTYLIDEQGIVSHVIDDPKCWNHGEQILRML